MKLKDILKSSLVASVAVAGAISLAACRADSDGSANGGPNGDGTGAVVNTPENEGGFPNDGGANGGTVPGGSVTEGSDVSADGTINDPGTPVAGGDSGHSFICTETAQSRFGATTVIAANGLLGGPLSDLLNMLGADSVTQLTNSVADKDLTIDSYLVTGSSFTLTASLLLNSIDSLDQFVFLPQQQPAGKYAVFALSFPAGTLNLDLLKSIKVTTYTGTVAAPVAQEAVTFDQVQIGLLGDLLGNLVGDTYAYVGVKTLKPYRFASVSLSTLLISADVGTAMKAHEFCTDGTLVANPA
ncbi:hypothetical protein E4T66_02240 [Sinimarinibacterium sp. CAU 1509]|uniref:hypothetical protein n=1 Tax=Sinimarinibacterium sp. CAU 1509 TaxID=2562283 RepID=UPI0010AC9818|nr:hypothetical protein [Sinimarinibacterium sp. CAU 1509]TJY65063.1 hypothetical protein E4T66_02240 [Sinimarinibacterium sp. CAU 1509]